MMDPIPDLGLELVAEGAIGKFNSCETIHVAVGKEYKKEKQNLLWVMRNFPRDTIGLVHVHWHSKWILTDCKISEPFTYCTVAFVYRDVRFIFPCLFYFFTDFVFGN